MKSPTTTQPSWIRLLVLLAALGSMGIAQANVRTIMDPTKDVPYYARIAHEEIYHDSEWAAVAFYRDPDCLLQTGFNLLDFFDVPAAFNCPCYVAGFLIWKNGPPPIDLAPVQMKLQPAPGQTVPVWFVRWSELESAIADDILTIEELAGLPSLLRGEADFFTETLHPLGGEAQQTMISLVASGLLENGHKFSFQATATKENNRLNHVKIQFE